DDNPDDGFEVVQHDAIPVAKPQPDASLEKRIATLREWLQPTSYLSPGDEFMKHLHSYATGTGQWTHESPVFQAWTDKDATDAACLHARGVAGSGKSVFAATTIRELQEAGHTVLFFFFRQIVEKKHAAKYLVRDFAAQLLSYCPETLVASLKTASEEHGVDGNEMDVLWPAITKAVSAHKVKPESGTKTGPVYCVVDALDEMDDADFDGMVRKLVALGATAAGSVKVMMTSRPLPKIEKALTNPGIAYLKLDPAMLYPDVARYVNTRMASLEKPLSEDKTQLVRDTICERASGLFLHARLAVDNLAEGLRDGEITEESLPGSLERIPSSLREVYEDMLREHARRSSVTAEQQAKILMCVTHASRPLRLIELGSLVSRLMSLDLRHGKELVRAACGRLLEILEDESVSVIHHSFTEFLHDEGRKQNPGAFPVLNDIASHSMLVILSLEYLDSCDPVEIPFEVKGDNDQAEVNYEDLSFSNKQDRKETQLRTNIKAQNPLMAYVTQNLGFHLLRASKGSTKELLEAIDKYLVPQKPAFQNWTLFLWKNRPYGLTNLFHLATGLHGDDALPLEYNRYEGWWVTFTEEEAEERRKTALSSAFGGDNPQVVAAFLPFTPSTELNSFFHQSRNVENLKAMLDTGKVDVDCYMSGTTRLYEAMRSPDLDTVKLLLEQGADPTKRCSRRRYYSYDTTPVLEIPKEDRKGGPTPLHALTNPSTRSVQFADDKKKVAQCLEIMIAAGADINATMDLEYGPGNMTPLHLAVEKTESMFGSWGSMDKSEEILTEALLVAGADPAAQNADGDTPIHLVNVGKPRVLQILMKHGGGKARNGRGRTPLHAMINSLAHESSFTRESEKPKNSAAFKMLLDPDEHIDLVDNDGNNIFHHIMHSITSLSRMQATSFIAELLDRGSPDDLNKVNKKGQSPLWRYKLCDNSCYSQLDDDEDILRMMADAGMDLNLRNGKGETILWRLAQFEKGLSLIKMFVRLGVDPKAVDNEGRTVLHAAVKRRRPAEWLNYLISVGVNVKGSSEVEHGKTLIHELLQREDDCNADYSAGIIALLVEAGLDPLAVNHKGQTALHVASPRSHLDLVLRSHYFKELNINQQDQEGFTPLLRAMSLRDEIAIYSLIQKGADPTLISNDGTSPLHLAARNADPGTLGFLLAHYREHDVLTTFLNSIGGGRTPLHFACQAGDVESVRLLLQHQADTYALDDNGLTPVHAVAEAEALNRRWDYYTRAADVVGLLGKAGAQLWLAPNEVDYSGVPASTATPLNFAIEKEAWNTARALMSHGARLSPRQLESPQVIIATDPVKAAEEAARAQRKSPYWNESISWRGRWASSHPKYMPSDDDNEKTVFITGGQTLLDALKQSKDVAKPGDIFTALESLLKQGDYDSIKEYAKLGGDLISPAGCSKKEFFYTLVREGHVDLLEYFEDQVLENDDEDDDDEGGTRTLLAIAGQRTEPSLHIIKQLVHRFGANLNALSVGFGGKSTPLHELAGGQYFWHIEALGYLLSEGADLALTDSNGFTPLLVAVSKDSTDRPWTERAVRLLLEHGADPNARVKAVGDEDNHDAGNHRPFAIELSRRAEITQLLLDHGARIDNCPSLLQRNIKDGMDPDNVKCLLQAGVDPNERPLAPDANHEDSMWSSAADQVITRYALHEAARPSGRENPERDFDCRQQATIDALISHGADPLVHYPDGSFVFQKIIEDRGRFDCLVPCLAQMDVNKRGSHGRSILAAACAPKSPAGAKVFIGGGYRSRAPMVMEGAILTLVKMKAVDVLIADDEGRTPLHLLGTFEGPFAKDQQALMALLEREPKAVHLKDSQGRTPLHLALETYATKRSTSTSVIRQLIRSGADVTEADPVNGNSALHYIAPRLGGEVSSATEATALFRDLVNDSALCLNARNNAGETPCFSLCAARWDGTSDPKGRESHPYYAKANDISHATALDVFVNLNADLTAIDAKGQNLLHVTAARELSDGGADWHEREDLAEVFKKLMALGVDPRKEDEGLRTAIDVAVARDLWDVVNLFGGKGEERGDKSE
ncbi:ankyrin, partial [Sarocladium strictum]